MVLNMMLKKILGVEDLSLYTKKEPVEAGGELWYYSPSGYRERVSAHAKKNKNRMFVNGKYVPTSHPLHKPGNYKALDDAWSHNKIETVNEGYVYAITNLAWKDWIKVGKAVDAEDRLNGYQTSSPFRDYKIFLALKVDNRHEAEQFMHRLVSQYAKERKGEWFKIDKDTMKELFNEYANKKQLA